MAVSWITEDVHHSRTNLAKYGVQWLRIAIILWAIFIIVLVMFIDNPFLLAGILLYEVLP